MNYRTQLVEHTERIFNGTNPTNSITIHDTGNHDVGADAQAHANLQSGNNVRNASWHEQVDDTVAIRSYPPTAQCWHAGDGQGPGNTTSYAIEFCVNADGDLHQTVANLVRVVIRRLDEFNLTVADIVDHAHWSNKRCPRVFKDQPGSWERFLQAVDTRNPNYPILQGDTMTQFSSPLPVGCRFTSGFGTRWGTLHAGADWGPPTPGQTGVPVYAIHDGPVITTGYNYGRATDRIPYHSGRFVWQDIGVHGGDRMRLLYNHLAQFTVRNGEHVKAGQVIGYKGGSGSSGENHFAIHLHLGVSVNHDRPIQRWNAQTNSGWTDPVVWLASKGIDVGTTPPVDAGGGAQDSGNVAPLWARKRTTQHEVPIMDGKGTGANQVGTASTKGYRLNIVKEEGSWTLVRFQVSGTHGNYWVASRYLNDSFEGTWEWPDHKLVTDGDFGPVSRRAYQRLLVPASVGNYQGWIDADISGLTVEAEQRWLQRHGFSTGSSNPGIRDQPTIKALQELLGARGFYQGSITGDFGTSTVTALQQLMNSQQALYS